jgi:hypothetical protein
MNYEQKREETKEKETEHEQVFYVEEQTFRIRNASIVWQGEGFCQEKRRRPRV